LDDIRIESQNDKPCSIQIFKYNDIEPNLI